MDIVETQIGNIVCRAAERVTRRVVPTSSIVLAALLKVVGLKAIPATPVASVLLTRTENHTVPLIGESSEQPLRRY